MSLDDVKEIIGRAVKEPEYHQQLVSDPKKALEGYDLTDAETALLTLAPQNPFAPDAGNLEPRISRAFISLVDAPDELGLKSAVNKFDPYRNFKF